MEKQIANDELDAAYRLLGYEIGLTHMGKVSHDDVRNLLRSIYEKRSRMNRLIADVERLLPVTSAHQ